MCHFSEKFSRTISDLWIGTVLWKTELSAENDHASVISANDHASVISVMLEAEANDMYASRLR